MKPPLTPMATLRYDRVRTLLPDDARTVLEIGCGQGALGYRLADGRRYLGLEPDAQSYAVARERLAALDSAEVRCSMLEELGADDTFDLVCAFEVLEHMADDRASLAQWIQHVRPGGHLIISTPAHPGRFGTSDRVAGHYRRYDPRDLRALLTAAGLEDVRVIVYGMPLGYALEHGRNRLFKRLDDGRRTPEERTSESGRLLQPDRGALAALTLVGTAPFRFVQRAFPNHGVGLVARARRPQAIGS